MMAQGSSRLRFTEGNGSEREKKPQGDLNVSENTT